MGRSTILSKRVSKVALGATTGLIAKLIALKHRGVDVVNFAVGESDLPTPRHIREAAKRFVDSGAIRYTEVTGTRDLRAAAATWIGAANDLRLSPENVIVSTGSKQVLHHLFHALLDDGDEVIVPSPCWTYPDQIALAGGQAVRVPCEPSAGFLPDPERVERAFGTRTKMLLITSPSNPTGAVFPTALLERLAALCARHDVVLVSDDIYRAYYYDQPPPSVGRIAQESGARWFIVDGVSKTYAMTGWRIGFGAGDAELIEAMAMLQSQSTSCASAVSQAAALSALTEPSDGLVELRKTFGERRRLMIDGVRNLPGFDLRVEPQGAFYVMPSVAAWEGALTPEGHVIANDLALVDYLLEDSHVALAGGTAFAGPGLVRISYATSSERITDGIGRIARSLDRLERVKA
jgi:aspartate aminotransferase